MNVLFWFFVVLGTIGGWLYIISVMVGGWHLTIKEIDEIDLPPDCQSDTPEQAQKRYDANEIKWMNIASGQLKRIEQLGAALTDYVDVCPMCSSGVECQDDLCFAYRTLLAENQESFVVSL